MRLLFYGDVVGKAGRQAVAHSLERARAELSPDFVIVNGENAAHGFGITAKLCEEFYALGVDVITTGNHVWDQREIVTVIDADPRLLRPLNFPDRTPGRGATVIETADGRKVLVISMICRLFMGLADDPFQALETILAQHRLGGTVDAIVLDVHGEATSEKQAIGHAADGRVSLVVGTHTHVPTADTRILAGGTAYQSDLGMCGVYDSVIGMAKANAIERFISKRPTERLSPASGAATACGVLVETDDRTGLAVAVAPLIDGGDLAPRWPHPGWPATS